MNVGYDVRLLVKLALSVVLFLFVIPEQIQGQNYHFSNGWMPGKRSLSDILTPSHSHRDIDNQLTSLNIVVHQLQVRFYATMYSYMSII